MNSESHYENRFAYALHFLKRFNAVIYKGKPLSHQKILDKYNVWIFFQTRIFFGDLKEFALKRKLPQYENLSPRIKVQNLIISLFGLIVSSLAIMGAVLFRRKFLVYSIDRINSNILSNDARLDPVYRYLKSSRDSFVECLHTTLDLSSIKRLFKRGRLVFYIRSIDFLFEILHFFRLTKYSSVDIEQINLSSFAPDEREFAKHLLLKYIAAIDRAVFKVKVLRKVLSWMSVETVITIDNTRDYGELILACRLEGIKTYAFQHGHFTKYHVGWLDDGKFDGEIVHPDKLFVWSEFWKQELIRLGTYFPEEAIVVGGLKEAITPASAGVEGNYIGVLIPYEIDADKHEMKKYMDKMLECGNIKIFFKLRTDVDSERQMKEYGINPHYNPNLVFISSVADFLPEINVVAGTYSTFLYDMIAHERPVILLETSSDFGEGLLINGLADSATINNVCERISQVASAGREILVARREKLFGKNPELMYKTVSKLCSEK